MSMVLKLSLLRFQKSAKLFRCRWINRWKWDRLSYHLQKFKMLYFNPTTSINSATAQEESLIVRKFVIFYAKTTNTKLRQWILSLAFYILNNFTAPNSDSRVVITFFKLKISIGWEIPILRSRSRGQCWCTSTIIIKLYRMQYQN